MDDLKSRFAICVNNQDHPASLEQLKIYQVVADARASELRFIRVIDESGEDYLYPAENFVAIELPKAVEEMFTPHDVRS